MKVKNLLMMALAVFSLSFASCGKDDGVGVEDDGTEETPGGEDTEDPDDNEDAVVFTISVTDIKATGATVSVVPSDATVTYYFDVIEKTELDEYADAKVFIEELIDDMIAYAESYDKSLADMLSTGNDSFTYYSGLMPSTEYYAYAVGIDADGNITSDVSTETFTTAETVPSSNTFTVTESNGYIEVTPSNNDPYVWDIYSTASLSGFSDDEIISGVISGLGEDLPIYTATGVDGYDYSEALVPGVSYTVLVFGYDGGPTTGLTKYEFTYEASDEGSSSEVVDVNDVNYALIEYWGAEPKSGAGDWYLTLMNEVGYLQMEFYTDPAVGADPEGKFVFDPEDTRTAGTASTKYSFYAPNDGYSYSMLAEGSFEITVNEDDTYTFVVDAKDKNGVRYTCNYTGTADLEDYTVESSLAAAKKAVKLKVNKAAMHRSEIRTVVLSGANTCKAVKLSSVLR